MTGEHDKDLAAVAGQLYGALMEARGYVARAANAGSVGLGIGSRLAASGVLERIDAALAEGGEYMGSDARWPT